MAPWGGIEPRVGNNPFSLAAPAPAGQPAFVLDMAQSAVARGRVKAAQLDGEPIPLGWGIDAQGRPTTDPAAALDGALLPVGGHKGYGLALAVEILAGALTGAALSFELVNTGLTGSPAPATHEPAATGVGNLCLVIDPDRFAGRETFLARMGDLAGAMASTRPRRAPPRCSCRECPSSVGSATLTRGGSSSRP